MLELNRIYNEDCLEGMKRIPDGSVDLVVTDPPYLMGYKTGRRKDKTHQFCQEIANDSGDAAKELIKAVIHECYRVLKPNSAMYCFCSDKTLDWFKPEIELAGFNYKNSIIWLKNSHTAGDLVAQFGKKYEPLIYVNKGRAPILGGRITDVWEFPRVAGKTQLHQNQKPTALIEQAVKCSSEPGQTVLDPFIGSGTTAVACINTGRNFIGFELDTNYWEIANKRIEDTLSTKTTA